MWFVVDRYIAGIDALIGKDAILVAEEQPIRPIRVNSDGAVGALRVAINTTRTETGRAEGYGFRVTKE